MAGFREFTAGEPLTATNVDDFLMKQSVMKFADAAARDLALGTAVVSPNALREGMIAYLDDTDEVIKYDGSGWVTVGAAGIGSNVVQTVKTDTFSSTATTFTDVTGLTVTITPSTATSKILLIAQVTWGVENGGSNDENIQFRLAGGNVSYQADAAGSRNVAVFTGRAGTGNDQAAWPGMMVYLDSPATTAATTYSVQLMRGFAVGTMHVNRSGSDINSNKFGRGASSITAIEVAV